MTNFYKPQGAKQTIRNGPFGSQATPFTPKDAQQTFQNSFFTPGNNAFGGQNRTELSSKGFTGGLDSPSGANQGSFGGFDSSNTSGAPNSNPHWAQQERAQPLLEDDVDRLESQFTQQCAQMEDLINKLSLSTPGKAASQIQSDIRSLARVLKQILEDLEEIADEKARAEELEEAHILVNKVKSQYSLLQQNVRRATLFMQKNAEESYKDQRKSLLGCDDPAERQMRIENEAQLAETAEDITTSLQRTRQMMAQELDHTSATLAAMDASESNLKGANLEFKDHKGHHRQSRKLLDKMKWHSRLDTWTLWGSFFTFLAIAAYITGKRGYYFVPQFVKNAPMMLWNSRNATVANNTDIIMHDESLLSSTEKTPEQNINTADIEIASELQEAPVEETNLTESADIGAGLSALNISDSTENTTNLSQNTSPPTEPRKSPSEEQGPSQIDSRDGQKAKDSLKESREPRKEEKALLNEETEEVVPEDKDLIKSDNRTSQSEIAGGNMEDTTVKGLEESGATIIKADGKDAAENGLEGGNITVIEGPGLSGNIAQNEATIEANQSKPSPADAPNNTSEQTESRSIPEDTAKPTLSLNEAARLNATWEADSASSLNPDYSEPMTSEQQDPARKDELPKSLQTSEPPSQVGEGSPKVESDTGGTESGHQLQRDEDHKGTPSLQPNLQSDDNEIEKIESLGPARPESETAGTIKSVQQEVPGTTNAEEVQAATNTVKSEDMENATAFRRPEILEPPKQGDDDMEVTGEGGASQKSPSDLASPDQVSRDEITKPGIASPDVQQQYKDWSQSRPKDEGEMGGPSPTTRQEDTEIGLFRHDEL